MTSLRGMVAVFALLGLASPALAEGISLPPAERVVLDNGAVLLLHRKTDVPLIGLQASLRGGAVSDPDGMNGMASLLADVLEQGAGQRDAAAFAEAVDAVGGRLSARAGLESVAVTGEFMARDAGLMVELLADMLRSPALDADEIRKLRERKIDALRSAKDSNLESLLPVYGNAFLFRDHPYGNPLAGSEATLATIGAEDLRGYYQQHFGGDRLVIAVVGDFEVAPMRAMLESAFADWPEAGATLTEINVPEPATGRRVLLVDKPGATQTYFWIGNVGVGIDHASRAELDIANTLFGGRFTSILNDELRTRAGLTYGARSSLQRQSVSGSIAMLSHTATATTVEAIDLALSLLAKLHTQGVPAGMVSSGKNYLLGQFAPRYETALQLAGEYADLEIHGLLPAYINEYGAAVMAAREQRIQEVIGEVYPGPDDLVFAIIGDAEAIREQVSNYGAVTEMPITAPRFLP